MSVPCSELHLVSGVKEALSFEDQVTLDELLDALGASVVGMLDVATHRPHPEQIPVYVSFCGPGKVIVPIVCAHRGPYGPPDTVRVLGASIERLLNTPQDTILMAAISVAHDKVVRFSWMTLRQPPPTREEICAALGGEQEANWFVQGLTEHLVLFEAQRTMAEGAFS